MRPSAVTIRSDSTLSQVAPNARAAKPSLELAEGGRTRLRPRPRTRLGRSATAAARATTTCEAERRGRNEELAPVHAPILAPVGIRFADAAERGGLRATGDARAGDGRARRAFRGPRARRRPDADQRDEGPCRLARRARRPRRPRGAEGDRAGLRRHARARRDDD